jgi:hypothetical protein
MDAMFTLTPSQAQLIGFIVAPTLFLLSAYFTRARPRRIAGALVGAASYTAVNIALDRIAASRGWWSYPAWSTDAQFPLTTYLLAGLVGGGAFGLVGWRVIRRWDGRGFAFFLLGWAVYAVLHDYGGSRLFASSGLMVFGPGLVPIVAIIFLYLIVNSVPQAAICLVAGPPTSDVLARSSEKENLKE